MSSPKRSVGRAAGIVSFCTFLSRIFGLIRDQLFAALLGAGFYSDAYVIAFRIPNLLRDLFAEGALSSAFVPTFTEHEVKRSIDDAWKLANLVIGVLLAVVGSLTLIGMIFTPQLVALIAPGFDAVPGKGDLTVLLTRIMFPFLPIVAISALFMGMLNVKEKFAIPAFAPVMFNLVSIVFGIALWTMEMNPRSAVIGWSIGTLLGGLAQGLIQVPGLWRFGWRWKPTIQGWRESEGLRQIFRLMLPSVIGLSATQVNILVNSILASLLEQGAPSWLNYSFRLMQLPIGVFGVAIGMVTLPRVSRDAASSADDAFRKNLSASMNLVWVLTIPSALGLWILSEPIIRLIYQHGAFHASDTTATAAGLAFFAIGLPAYAAVKVIAPAFFARKDSKSPMIASMTAVTMNITSNLLLYKTLGFRGLALGTSVSALTNLFLLMFWFQKKHLGLPMRELIDRVFRILLASLAMALVAHFSYLKLHQPNGHFGARLIETFVPIFLSTATYIGGLMLLRVPETKLLAEMGKKIYERWRPR